MKVNLTSLMLVDASFRHTVDPLQTPEEKIPAGGIGLEVELIKGQEANAYAVKLKAALESADVKYALNVTYAAILLIDPEGEPPPDQLEHRLMVTGASMLFPYCREVISNLTARGRFGPVWLSPTNFNVLLANKQIEEVVLPEQQTITAKTE